MSKILTRNFFERSAVSVAKDLLGKKLVRVVNGKKEKYTIIETESYEGYKDLASKSSRGKTLGNLPMFGKPGKLYVYFTYGMHYMLNITTCREGFPGAVLIRGVEGSVGPGRLTKRLLIDKQLNDLDLGKKSGVWIENGDLDKFKIKRTPRIGIDSSGPIWSKKLLRFVLVESQNIKSKKRI